MLVWYKFGVGSPDINQQLYAIRENGGDIRYFGGVIGASLYSWFLCSGLVFGHQTISQEVYDDLRKKLAAITAGFLAQKFLHRLTWS